jgi:2-polyprenyl-3-methyl-5-hydroxy-6-metoxy-1,4-benzoquinol methylase
MLILDLCAGSGAWSKPYEEAGYEVLKIDLPQDVRLFEKLAEPVHGAEKVSGTDIQILESVNIGL